MRAPRVFHGEWWVPAKRVRENGDLVVYSEGPGKKFTGTLTYHGNSESVLELFHVPSDFQSTLYHENEVMWGKDANGAIYTLFCVKIKEQNTWDFTNTLFSVELILIGKHVSSKRDICSESCIVQYPYLRNWAFLGNVPNNHAIIEVSMGDGIKWVLRNKIEKQESPYDLTISRKTELVIESSRGISVYDGLRLAKEFAQFLSIALYCEQKPTSVHFVDKREPILNIQRQCSLLFERNESCNPNGDLIKFNELNEKLPSMLQIWHKNFESLSPISGYLITSLKKNRYFGAPDFLIIAQALDGYFKRFVGKNINERIKRYEKQIEKLLDQFKDIDVIKKSHINSVVLKDSRHKYSHLFPDDEPSQAVAGEDLYWLTEKSKILLTCCILDMLGLSTEEINLCCNNSPISKIAEEFETEDWLMGEGG